MSLELEALASRVLILEQVIDNLPGGREALHLYRSHHEQHSQVVPVAPASPVKTMIPVMMTIHAYGFSSYRQARECLEALALCHGVSFVGSEFPSLWLQQLESIRHARVHGMTWREALERAGLTVNSSITDLALDVARETERLEGVLQKIATAALEFATPKEHYAKLLEPLLED